MPPGGHKRLLDVEYGMAGQRLGELAYIAVLTSVSSFLRSSPKKSGGDDRPLVEVAAMGGLAELISLTTVRFGSPTLFGTEQGFLFFRRFRVQASSSVDF